VNHPVVSVVLPAHNESALLEAVVTEIVRGLEERQLDHEIMVVENGSSDGTAAIARKLASSFGSVRALALEQADYGRAIATGIEQATAQVVVLFDVDYFDLHFLDEAVAMVREGKAAIVLASKRAPGAEDLRPVMRRFLTAGFTTAMRTLLRLPVTDAHGMKALSREVCAPLAKACSMGGPLFDVELVVRASRAGVPIVELPARVRERRPPRTPVLQRSIESAVGLLRLRRLMKKGAEEPKG
jgi:glycosyltransferase involved in cell wall biosynthesis